MRDLLTHAESLAVTASMAMNAENADERKALFLTLDTLVRFAVRADGIEPDEGVNILLTAERYLCAGPDEGESWKREIVERWYADLDSACSR